MEPDSAAALISTYGYFRAKAAIYLRKGCAAYRRDDYFHVPREEWTQEELCGIERAFLQVVDWKGLILDAPLENVDLCDLYRIIEVAHFRLEQLSLEAGDTVVTLALRHRVDVRALILRYNLPPAATRTARGAEPPEWMRYWRSCRPRALPAATESRLIEETRGYTPDNPLVCCDPSGERSYLRDLRCPNGHRFYFRRIGSLPGRCPEPSAHEHPFPCDDTDPRVCVVDKYVLQCGGGEHTCTLYFDMYHPLFLVQPIPKGLRRAAREET